MAVKLPKELQLKVRAAVYQKADEFGYAFRGRGDNGDFMTSLITDSEIGGTLSEYMSKANIRTYIKDAVLNRYTKDLIGRKLSDLDPASVVSKVFNEYSIELSSKGSIHICANAERIYIICDGTVTKWETALRKALETASNLPNEGNKTIRICLRLASLGATLSKGDRELISKGLSFIGAKVYFCS